MERKIWFKALNAKNEWIYGLPYTDGVNDTAYYKDYNNRLCWRNEDGASCNQPYKNGTLCQLTGLTDKNRVDIFEGDKFKNDDDEGGYFLIEWDNNLSKFSVNVYSCARHYNEGGGEVYDNEISLVDKNIIDVIDLRDDYIIGNIHDNPELIKITK